MSGLAGASVGNFGFSSPKWQLAENFSLDKGTWVCYNVNVYMGLSRLLARDVSQGNPYTPSSRQSQFKTSIDKPEDASQLLSHQSTSVLHASVLRDNVIHTDVRLMRKAKEVIRKGQHFRYSL